MIDKLREEIVESQKARNEFMRWKLILVAAIGAAGLGIGTGAAAVRPVALLALIPFVCLYVDAVCFHNDIRILAIANFLRVQTEVPLARSYEEHCRSYRRHFSLEEFALLVTTVVLSLLVAVIGWDTGVQSLIGMSGDAGRAGHVLVYAGLVGAAAEIAFWAYFRLSRRELDDVTADPSSGT